MLFLHARRFDKQGSRSHRHTLARLLRLESLELRALLSGTQFGAEQAIIGAEAQFATSVFAADIDGDGDLDMLSTSGNDDKIAKIAWYENTDGAGHFDPQQVISRSADGPTSVYAADVDGDGDVDVLSASDNDDKIAWYENLDGEGMFGPQRVISRRADRPQSVVAADLDGDGDFDVVSASSKDRKVAWYENLDGAGNFGPERYVGEGFWSVCPADLDGDGDTDLLSSSKLAWYENDGEGNFGPEQVIDDNASTRTVFAADLDGDDDMDVLYVGYVRGVNRSAFVWYENLDGEGSFGPRQVISNTTDALPRSVFATDLDSDGDVDVLSGPDGKLAWYRNLDGAGTFGPQQVIIDDYATSVFAADLDFDGDQDVLYSGGNKVAWFDNLDGEGTFVEDQVVTELGAIGARSVYAADLDGDGDQDALSASSGDNTIAWYENTDGFGTFGTQQVINNNAIAASWVFATDLDGDRDLDVLSASAGDATVAWYENRDGAGSFGPQRVITQLIQESSSTRKPFYVEDLDGDGDKDLVTALSETISWFENTDGLGNFGPPRVIANAADEVRSLYTADLNGDGDLDLLSASAGNDTITFSWYESVDGTGTFGSRQVITTETGWSAISVMSVLAADVDVDGDLDVITLPRSDELAWYENIGAGSFRAKRLLSNDAPYTYSIFAADLDNDGDLDVLTAGSTAYDHAKVGWFENFDGAGNFGPQQAIPAADTSWGYSIYASDLDNDGDLDVLSASELDDKIAWYETSCHTPVMPTAMAVLIRVTWSRYSVPVSTKTMLTTTRPGKKATGTATVISTAAISSRRFKLDSTK